jgi:TRAP-type C4-dicarboxylate transport system permease small subunit
MRVVQMTLRDRLVSQRQRHLKWPALDPLETVLMVLCGVLLFGFCTTVIFDIVTREIRHPWLWLQEVTSTFFIYAIFTGTAVASRRNDHLYLTAVGDNLHGRVRTIVEVATRIVVLVVALCFVYFGYLNFLRGFTSFRMPSMTPIASLYAAIPLSGALIALFMVEQLVNGCRNGFERDEDVDDPLLARTIEAIQPVPAAGESR